MAPGSIADEIDSGWSSDIREFFAAWCALRGDSAMPASEDFFDRADPGLLSTTYVCDMTDEGAVMRFQSIELVQRWGVDVTGAEIHRDVSATFKERSLHNMRRVVNHPCGCLIKLSFSTSKGRLLHSEVVQLPLAVQPGRWPRVLGHALHDVGREWEEASAGYRETRKVVWLDIGAGVPPEPPLDLLQRRR